MIAVTVDASEVTRLAELLEESPQVIASAKQAAIFAAAPKMKAIVDEEIGGSGKVRSWQEKYVGSKGGYAAVRPKKETWTEATKKKGNRYAVGYVTNAINSGHRAPRAQFAYKSVRGKFFYQRASVKLGKVAEDAAISVCLAVTSHLAGTKTAAVPETTPHAGDFQPFTKNIGGKLYTFRHV